MNPEDCIAQLATTGGNGAIIIWGAILLVAAAFVFAVRGLKANKRGVAALVAVPAIAILCIWGPGTPPAMAANISEQCSTADSTDLEPSSPDTTEPPVIDCDAVAVPVNDECSEVDVTCSDGQVIVDGACSTPPPVCDPSEALVGDVCVPRPTECAADETLTNGVCIPLPPVCSDDQVLVDGECVSPPIECEFGGTPINGACIPPCPAGTYFDGEACVRPPLNCPVGTIEVGETCVEHLICNAGEIGLPNGIDPYNLPGCYCPVGKARTPWEICLPVEVCEFGTETSFRGELLCRLEASGNAEV